MKAYLLFSLLFLLIAVAFSQQSTADSTASPKFVYTCPPCSCPHDGHHFAGPGQCPSCNMTLRVSYTGIKRTAISRPRRTVAILLFDGADIMDVTGPWSVFEHAGMTVITVAKTASPKRIGMTLEVQPDYTLENMPKVDALVFPGGGPAESNQDPEIIDWIKQRNEDTGTLFSVCSGAFFLGKAGLLDDHQATTFASLIPQLQKQFPKAHVLNDVKYTDNGKVITSAGLSSGIDASFHVVAKYFGEGRAQDVANHMEYPWSRDKDYARTQLADNFIVGVRELLSIFATKYLTSLGDRQQWTYQYLLSDQVAPEEVLRLIGQELKGEENWSGIEVGQKQLTALASHGVLGNGAVAIRIKKTEMGHIATLSVKKGPSVGKVITIPSQFTEFPLVEPHISAHPTQNDHLLVAAMVITDVTNPYQSARLSSFVSHDGGTSWTETAHDWWGYDPWTAILPNGQTAMTWLGTPNRFQHQFPIQFFSSHDGGINWKKKVQGTSGSHDGTKIATHGDDFYFTSVQFNDQMGADVVLYHRKGDGPFELVAEVDGKGKRLNFCEPAVLSDGKVIVPASDFLKRIWVHTFDPATEKLSAAHMVSLKPGGAKGYMHLVADNHPQSPFKDRTYFVRALGSRGDFQGVWINYSTNGGVTWTEDARVDHFTNDLPSKAQVPSVAVNKQGVIAISWVDAQHDPTQAKNDVYFAYSLDGGDTFSQPTRVTTTSTDPRTAANADVAKKFPGGGHYLGITTKQDDSFQLIWSDSQKGIFELKTCNVQVSGGF